MFINKLSFVIVIIFYVIIFITNLIIFNIFGYLISRHIYNFIIVNRKKVYKNT
jgi:hypothetical protein